MNGFPDRIIIYTETATYFIADRESDIPPGYAERLAEHFGIEVIDLRRATLIIMG